MANIIAICNHKGGIGKSATSCWPQLITNGARGNISLTPSSFSTGGGADGAK